MAISGLTATPYQLQPATITPLHTESGIAQRQFFAAAATVTGEVAEQTHTEASQKSEKSGAQQAFLDQMLEQMLANRIGLDKKKYNEILERMKQLEAEKEKLAQQPQTPARDNQMSAIDQKLVQLNKALEGLIAQANKIRDYRERAQYSAEAVIEQYRGTAFVNSEQKVRV